MTPDALNDAELLEAKYASELLSEICDHHPARMTLDELHTALPARGSRMIRDDIDIAAHFLEAHGLARREGDCLVPTLAAVTAYLLWRVASLNPSLD